MKLNKDINNQLCDVDYQLRVRLRINLHYCIYVLYSTQLYDQLRYELMDEFYLQFSDHVNNKLTQAFKCTKKVAKIRDPAIFS